LCFGKITGHTLENKCIWAGLEARVEVKIKASWEERRIGRPKNLILSNKENCEISNILLDIWMVKFASPKKMTLGE